MIGGLLKKIGVVVLNQSVQLMNTMLIKWKMCIACIDCFGH